MNEDDDICVLNDIGAEGKGETDSLPERSKLTYKKSYDRFNSWKSKNKVVSCSEKVLLDYFKELSVKFKPTSLATEYSKLKAMLNICDQIDISRYLNLLSYLKHISEGYKTKKTKTFSRSQIKKFIDEAPDQFYLLYKVAAIFGVTGACSRQELYKLKFKDVYDLQENKTLIVSIWSKDKKIDRKFGVAGTYYDICTKYLNLRPPNCPNGNFFLRYYKGSCAAQNIGINSFGAMGKVVARYLKLPNSDLYTGHCFRRSAEQQAWNDVPEDASSEPEERIMNCNKTTNTDVLFSQLQGQKTQAQVVPSRDSHTRAPRQDPGHVNSTDTTSSPQVGQTLANLKQCRFCCGYTTDCVPVTGEKPYLMNNRTNITINGLTIDLDFDSIKSVCRYCDGKLQEVYDFVNFVKNAQDKLNNIERETEFETVVIKMEPSIEDTKEGTDPLIEDTKEGIDLLTVGEREFVKQTVLAYKRKADTAKEQKIEPIPEDTKEGIDLLTDCGREFVKQTVLAYKTKDVETAKERKIVAIPEDTKEGKDLLTVGEREFVKKTILACKRKNTDRAKEQKIVPQVNRVIKRKTNVSKEVTDKKQKLQVSEYESSELVDIKEEVIEIDLDEL